MKPGIVMEAGKDILAPGEAPRAVLGLLFRWSKELEAGHPLPGRCYGIIDDFAHMTRTAFRRSISISAGKVFTTVP